jgi:hypothetical protein
MVTVLEEYATEEQHSVMRFFFWGGGAKGLNAKDIHKEMFAVHNWVVKFPQGRSKVADDIRTGAEVAETIVERLLCCGFRRIGKAMGQVY